MKVLKGIKRFLKEDEGISAVEYALLLALVGVAISAAAIGLGTQIGTNMTTATTTLAGS
jgi:pilus assembly protein Flp/PilA